MGCAHLSCKRDDVEVGVITFVEMEKLDVTFCQTGLSANSKRDSCAVGLGMGQERCRQDS